MIACLQEVLPRSSPIISSTFIITILLQIWDLYTGCWASRLFRITLIVPFHYYKPLMLTPFLIGSLCHVRTLPNAPCPLILSLERMVQLPLWTLHLWY